MTSPTDLRGITEQLREVEARIRADIRERDLAWRDLAGRAMLLLARMIAEVAPPRAGSHPGHSMDQPGGFPIPDLTARPINVEEYHEHAPEKFELLAGYLFSGPADPEPRHRLLALLLVNVGLVEAVRLAPEALWREALRSVYGTGGRAV